VFGDDYGGSHIPPDASVDLVVAEAGWLLPRSAGGFAMILATQQPDGACCGWASYANDVVDGTLARAPRAIRPGSPDSLRTR
jgi:hypothetical protein